MIRNWLLPALTAGLAAALLGGCVSDYQYRGGNGDYYYGQPSVEYRDYGYGGYGGGYGYPGGWSGSIGYGSGYGGSSYGYGGYGSPYGYGGYGGYPYWRPPIIIVRPGPHGGGQPDNDGDNDGDARPSSGLPSRDRDDLHRSQPPGPMPSIQSPRPMLSAPFSGQERTGQSRMQAPVHRAQPERDGRRKTTP